MSVQPTDAYTGVDNLEVMREAHNYNRYLLRTVQAHAMPGARVLDFGAGNGQFAAPLAAQGVNIVAVEPDAVLQRLLAERGIRAFASAGDLPDSAVDYAYTLNVLEHIDDDTGALRDLHAKLNARGRLLVYVPAFPILYTSMDTKVGHVRRYTRATLTAAVVAAGFRVQRVEYVDSIGFFATLVFKHFGSKDGSINRGALKLYDRVIFPISRALDLVARRWLGKSLLLVASKQ